MKKTLAAGAAALALSGCASIFSGSTQPITIMSVPDAANVTVTNRAGDKIHAGVTPVTLTLKRGAGYFKSESYRIMMEKPGYASREVVVTGTVNGWYFGNLLFGGLIGLVAVDPATGAMYSFPHTVTGTRVQDPNAAPVQATGAAQANNTLTIVSTDTLSPEVMKQARPLTAPK